MMSAARSTTRFRFLQELTASVTTVALLCTLMSLARAETAAESLTLDRVLFATSKRWYVSKNRAVDRNVLYFRKFSFAVIDDKLAPNKTKNIVSFGCQRNINYLDHFTIYIPEWITLKTIDEKSWVSRFELRVAVDDGTFTTPAEYRNKEIYVDLTGDNRDQLLRLLSSENVRFEFGPAQERIAIYQSDRTPEGGNLDGFIGDLATLISKTNGGGPVQSFDGQSMLDVCAKFKRTGKY